MEVNEIIHLILVFFPTIYQTCERKGEDSCEHMIVCV